MLKNKRSNSSRGLRDDSFRSLKPRRSLFDSKRKRDYLSELDPTESPTKYMVINSESSEDEKDDFPLTPELRSQYDRHSDGRVSLVYVKGKGLIYDSPQEKTLPYESSGEDSFDCNVTDKCPLTPILKRDHDMEITEFTTPQKEHNIDESDSSPKTPLLGSSCREDVDLDITEYVSPARGCHTAKSVKGEEYLNIHIPTSEDSNDESQFADKVSLAARSKSKTKRGIYKRNKIAKQIKAEPTYDVQDCTNLSLVVLKSYALDNADGQLDGILVWTLCYDVIYDIERYVVFIQPLGKSIKTGVCIRLFPPWQVSILPYVDGEIIHSVHLYQIILPSLLDITTEKIREVVNKSTVTYSKFQGSVPGCNGLQILQRIPQLLYNVNTVSRQAVSYRTSANIDGMVWLTFSISGALHILIRDCEMVFAVVEIPSDGFSRTIRENVFTKFTHLICGERITYYTNAPLFSVLRKLGSSQEMYIKFQWRPGSDLIEFKISPVPTPVIPEIHIPLPELQKTSMIDTRVSVKGVIYVLTQSELFIYENGTRIRVNLLTSFRRKELIEPTDVGRMIEISLLRVTNQNVYTLDQYSSAKFVDELRYSLRSTQTSSSLTPIH